MIAKTLLAGVAAVAIAAMAGPAAAQAPNAAPPPSGPDALAGPLVGGVCFLSREAVFANAKVGLAVAARLRQLTTEAQSEVDGERSPLEAELKALQAQRATLTPAQLDATGKPLAARWDAIQAKAALRSRELEVTRAKALDRISLEARPVIAQAYRSKACGLLLAREVMLGGNGGGDLTAAVVQGLDAKLTTLSFSREALPAAAPAAAAPAVR